MAKDQEKLDALRQLERENGMVQEEEEVMYEVPEQQDKGGVQFDDSMKNQFQKQEVADVRESSETVIDGYKILQSYDLPNNGVLYPDNWKFAYRCPTTKEVANFSTIQDDDTPAVISAIEELVKKCVKIIDIDNNAQILSTEINDAHKLFFMIKLREFYLPGSPIEYDAVCDICHEQYKVRLDATSLVYNEINQKLIDAFDGRRFTLDVGLDEPVVIYIPTIGTSSKIFKYIVKVYRDQQMGVERNSNDNKTAYDKKFLLVAPYLFETGKESIKEIIAKYNAISKNDQLFNAYMNIANKMKLDNLQTIDTTCPHCESPEETPLKFPGGWSQMFIGRDTTGYFD